MNQSTTNDLNRSNRLLPFGEQQSKKMSLTTYFSFTETSYLPLPPIKVPNASSPTAAPPPESTDDIQVRGIKLAIRMLHQPELMIALNPLVQHYNVIRPSDAGAHEHLVDLDRLAPEFNVTLAPESSCANFSESKHGEFVHYEIVDKFQLLGGLTSKLLTYRACFRPLYDPQLTTLPAQFGRDSIGLETISDPGNGVALLGKWIVGIDDQKPGFLKLSEHVQVHCNVFMGWFVKGQLETAHAALHKEFGRQFVEHMVAEDPLRGKSERVGKTWKQNEEEMRQVGVAGSAPVSRIGTGSEADGILDDRPVRRVATDDKI